MHSLSILGFWALATLAAAQNVNRTALANVSIVYDTWAAFEGCLPQPSGYGLIPIPSNDLKSVLYPLYQNLLTNTLIKN